MVRTHLRLLLALTLAVTIAGCKRHEEESKERMYVSVPQVMLRDRVAAVYNKVGVATNGEKLVVLDRQKRFVKVRTPRNEEGWVEQRYLADEQVYAAAQKLANQYAKAPSQGKATARNDTNLHVEAGREADHLYLVKEGDKIDVLERATAEKPGTRITPKDPTEKVPPPVIEDWRLVRDARGHVGWVLARQADLDVPIDVAQYAEGQRIQGYFTINEVEGKDGKKVPQILLALSEPKDGLPNDYSQIRLFTWNPKRDHYETAYRERDLQGKLPIKVGEEDFGGKEGKLPTFTLQVENDEGKLVEEKYKLNGVMVRRVLAPGEEPPPKPHREGRRRR
jgi:SH3-like domain-containing protein